MEISIAFCIQCENPAQAKFMGSCLSIDTKPVDADEVQDKFRAAFETLEFVTEPDDSKQENNICYGFFECIGSIDYWQDLKERVQPYVTAGARRVIAIVYADEGEDWYELNKNGIHNINRAKKMVNKAEHDAPYGRLKSVLEQY